MQRTIENWIDARGGGTASSDFLIYFFYFFEILDRHRRAQRAGMRAFLVTMGKHKKEDAERSVIKSDAVLDSIAI